MKELIIIVLAVLLSTGIAFAKNQNGKGTSGDQGSGHATAGNQGNAKDVGNGGGSGEGGTVSAPESPAGSFGGGTNGSDEAGTLSAPGGIVGSVGDGPVGSFSGGTNSNSGYGSNMTDSDPQSGYGTLKEPKCNLIEWFKNDLECP